MLSTRLCINSDPDLPEGLLSFQNVGLLLDKIRQACLSQIRILIVCQTQLKLLQMLIRQSCQDRNAFKVQPEPLPGAALRGGRLRRGCDNSEKARGNDFHNHLESLECVCCKNLPSRPLLYPVQQVLDVRQTKKAYFLLHYASTKLPISPLVSHNSFIEKLN